MDAINARVKQWGSILIETIRQEIVEGEGKFNPYSVARVVLADFIAMKH